MTAERSARKKVRIIPISLDNRPFRWRPFDSKCGIVPADAPCVFRGIKLGHLVKDLGVIFEGLKSMSEPFGDVDHLAVLRGELDGDVLLERWGRSPQIDEDVINTSRYTPHQLRF